MKDASGNVLSGTEFTLQGEEHKGLYVVDEDNFYSGVKQPSKAYLESYYVVDANNVGSVHKLGSQYNSETNLYTRSGGVKCYKATEVTVNLRGGKYPNDLYSAAGVKIPISLYYDGGEKTYYTISDGATRYTTEKVETPLYTDGGTHNYTMYKKVSKKLYEAGTKYNYTAYKAYGGKVYDAGKVVTFNPAEIETEDVTALTV